MRTVRHVSAAVLVPSGILVWLFSAAVAYGWGKTTLSALGVGVAVIGYAIVFAGYMLLRDSNWQLIASVCMKGILLIGSALLIPAFVGYKIETVPSRYFLYTSVLSIFGYVWFRKHENAQSSR